MTKVSINDDVYEEIDHKKPCEEAVFEATKQWGRHLKKFMH